MFQRFIALITLVALACGAYLFYQEAWVASRSGVDSPLYCVERFDPYGTAALYRLLQKRGLTVQLLKHPHMVDQPDGVMIEVLAVDQDDTDNKQTAAAPATQPASQPSDDQFRDPSKLPIDEVLQWVAKGNTLIQLTRARTAVMDRLDIPVARPSPWLSNTAAGTHPPSPTQSAITLEDQQRHGTFPKDLTPIDYGSHWLALARSKFHLTGAGPALRMPQCFGQHGPKTWQPLARSSDGQIVAGQINYGKGRVIVVGAPTPALNHTLNSADNLNFLLRAVGQHTVIFDAWAHHLGQTGTVMGLIRRFGLLPALLQFILLAFIYHWSTRGIKPVHKHQPARPRSSAEQIQTLGHLYQQAMQDEDAAQRTADEVGRRIASALRCPPDQIQARLAHAPQDIAAQARQLIEQIQTITSRQSINCKGCGYDLRGNTATHCPECGRAIDRKQQRQIASFANQPITRDHENPSQKKLLIELANLLNESHELLIQTQRGNIK